MMLGVLLLVGCGKEREEREKVLAAIDRLQAAPALDHAGRKTLAKELLNVAVETPAAVRARDACGNAYVRLAESNELSEALEKELADPTKKSDPADLVKRLEESENLIKEAEPLLQTCMAAKADLVAAVGR